MPESLKNLRRRIRTVRATKQITRAMEMVAAAKLRRAQEVLLAARPYAHKLQELLGYLATSSAVQEHPLFAEREERRRTMVLFTSDRGLAGSFNTNIIRMVEVEMKSRPEFNWELYCIGRKGHDYFRRRDWPIIEARTGLSGRPETGFAQQINEDLLQRYLAGETDAIYFAYPRFVSMAVNRPTITKFLKLDADELVARGDADKAHRGVELDYILEPSAQEVFESLVPRFLTSKIYITLAETFTSEHSARMLAMNNATRNCNELMEELTLKLNKARQQQITNELIDIIGGAQAV